jgi:competence protein ComEC
LGDTRYLDDNIKGNYQSLGISHLFSISGMHISILTFIIMFIFKKLKIDEDKGLLLSSLFIIYFMFLVNYCPSVLRSGIFYIFISINKIFYFNIKNSNLLLFTISIILFINPFIIYNTGFLYSSIITWSLIVFSSFIKIKDCSTNIQIPII